MGFVKKSVDIAIQGDERKRERDLPGLLQQLQEDDPAIRRWAVRDLAQYPEAVPHLIDLLNHETVPFVREAIFTSLVTIGSLSAVEGLLSCLRSDDAALRNETIEALQNLPDLVVPFIDKLLADPDSDVRILTINILEALKHPNVEDWLIKVIQQDPHVNVCTTAVDVLSEVGTEKALPALESLKERFPGETFVQFAVDTAVATIRGA
jgi:HEAT repeat protein